MIEVVERLDGEPFPSSKPVHRHQVFVAKLFQASIDRTVRRDQLKRDQINASEAARIEIRWPYARALGFATVAEWDEWIAARATANTRK